MKKIATSIMAVLCLLGMSAQNPVNHTYTPNDGPDKNPMKGWNSGWWDDFDEASVGFQYLKWNEFEPTDDIFNFNAVEDVINRPGSAGRHVIIRLYTDWFGANQESDAGPNWLYSDYGVERLQAPNGKYITNYNHQNYISQVSQAINALAAEYDDDPRIYAIQLGVLGYWGEWHTFSYDDDDFEIASTTMNDILSLYDNVFQNKKVMGRYPWREPLASANIGFHNDFFKPNNGHSDEFDTAIDDGNKWQDGPIGGEIPPIDDGDSEQFMTDLYETSAGINMIETGHYSTMKVGSDERPCDSDPNGSKCQGFMQMHRTMGYNFQIESAIFPETLGQSDNLNVELTIDNIGVTHMYYDWDVQFALLDAADQPVKIFTSPYDVTGIMPDEAATLITSSTALSTVSVGDYQLAVRLVQPEADANKATPWNIDARNAYVLFSNDLPIVDGSWGDNNELIGGWSILGPVAIEATTAAVSNVLIYHETNGFRHGSIDDGINLITDLGVNNGFWTTTETQDSSNFNATTLANFDLVIWCNTSGNGLLSAAEQLAFETWMTNGGAFMGVHAATDTYRNGSWPFYNELVGAIVQTGPNHTSNNHNDDMDILEKHSAVDHLGAVWNKTEEYYYWELNGGQLSPDNNNVLFVDDTGGNSYDAARPMAWYKTSVTVGGTTSPVRAFYTALGHNDSDYNSDTDFQQHIEGAIIWALPPRVTTYAGGTWDNGTPDGDMLAIVDQDYNTGTNGAIEARDLVVNSGNTLTVAPDSFIEIRENITVNGSLIVEHEGSVTQTSPVGVVTNNGTINVQLTTPDLASRDFMILGSPMTNESVTNVWDTAFLVLEHNTLNFIPNPDVEAEMPGAENFADDNYDNWTGHTGAIISSEGYIVRPQAGYGEPGGVFNYTYANGTLNNGTFDFDIIYQEVGTDAENKNHSPNVLSNPYASAIWADDFINANDAVQEVFFWEHLTPPNPDIPGAGSMNFSMEDISMYNLTGGMPAANDPGTSTTPNGFISMGQGFAIKANSAADVVFTNRMRRTDNNNTLRFTNEAERIWLSVTNDNYEVHCNTLIGFNDTATANMDNGYDSKRLATVVSLYSHLDDGSEQLGIQSREAFNENIKIPVGFSTQIDESLTYRIGISALGGEQLSQAEIYLWDNETNVLTNLNEGDYEFASRKQTIHNRFTLQFTEEVVLDTTDFNQTSVVLYPNPSSELINIKVAEDITINAIKVYDMLGKEIEIAIQNKQLNISSLYSGLYIVKIDTSSGMVTKRFIKN